MTAHRTTVIHIEAQAPAKPGLGAPCNGCGVCCLSEPCPVGMLLSRRRRGACVALRWDGARAMYRCGLLASAGSTHEEPVRVDWNWRQRLLRRWIAAGAGCDCALEVEAPAPARVDIPIRTSS